MSKKSKCNPECSDGRHYDLTEDYSYTPCPNACNKPLDCGGNCCLEKGHEGFCECAGENPGEPGTCPA